MEYVEAIGTIIVLVIVPAIIVCAIVGAPDSSRQPPSGAARPPSRTPGAHQ